MQRARELEEAGAATAVTQGWVDDELEGMGQALRGSRPSKVEYNKRRDRMAATGVEHEADSIDVATAVANGTLADGAEATSEANATQLQVLQVNAQQRRPRKPRQRNVKNHGGRR